MQNRLTIEKPCELGETLADAVSSVCARDLTITPTHLDLLDARLACGDFESVLALLRQVSRDRFRNAAPPTTMPLFLARYLRWTGDLQSAAAMWNDAIAALEIGLQSTGRQSLLHATCVEFAPVATDLGDVQLAARLHGVARAIATMPEARRDDVDAAAGSDVALIRLIAFDTIGIDPDASRGRLRLRPRLDRLDEMHVRSIRFGDGSISMRAERTRESLSIRVVQDAGSMPITVLLEPFVRDPGPATVDGLAADLTAQSVDHGTILPVQLVLDEERALTVHNAAERGRSPE